MAALQFGIPLAQWLDLSTGIAPYGWALPDIPVSAWQRLPETEDGLEAAARDYYGCSWLLAVAGSQAAIQALPRLRSKSVVGMLPLAYAEHGAAWRRHGHKLLSFSEASIHRAIDRVDVLVLVNPNNPTGRLIEPEQLLAWHARLARRGGWLVVDEAFMDNTPHLSLAAHAHQVGLIVLRSFGKFFGLAGVRLGFVLAERKLLRLLAEQVGPWVVSGPTRVLGQACLQDTENHTRQRIRSDEASERLAALLERYGFKPQGGCALFQWLITEHAHALHEFMARRGILLRLFTHSSSLRFGLPANAAEEARLEQALIAFTKDNP